MMRRGKGGENEVVSNPQRSPRSKKVLKSCYWVVRRRRRKASDEDRRTQMCLTVRLAELRRKKANALRRDDPVRRITTKGRHSRRAPRRSNGEEEGAAARKGGKVQGPRQPIKNGENRRPVPRWKEASRGRFPTETPSKRGRIDEKEERCTAKVL